MLAAARSAARADRADRTGLFAFIEDDHPGALLELLTEFAVRGVNLSRIESRPTGGRLGQYFFSLDCDGHVADERVGEALSALHRVCADVRVLGSWARADGIGAPVAPRHERRRVPRRRSLVDPAARPAADGYSNSPPPPPPLPWLCLGTTGPSLAWTTRSPGPRRRAGRPRRCRGR